MLTKVKIALGQKTLLTVSNYLISSRTAELFWCEAEEMLQVGGLWSEGELGFGMNTRRRLAALAVPNQAIDIPKCTPEIQPRFSLQCGNAQACWVCAEQCPTFA